MHPHGEKDKPATRPGHPVAWKGMHDLQFVRANLALVEEKLRARGQDPGVVLGSFETFDLRRRQNISESEAAKAQRNKLSQEVARLKKSGQDATAIMEQVRILKEQSEGADREVEKNELAMQKLLDKHPQSDAGFGACRHIRA